VKQTFFIYVTCNSEFDCCESGFLFLFFFDCIDKYFHLKILTSYQIDILHLYLQYQTVFFMFLLVFLICLYIGKAFLMRLIMSCVVDN